MRRAAVCIGVAISVVSAVHAQNSDKIQPPRLSSPDAFANACGRDHRIEFRLGSVSLFVAPRWLDIRSHIMLSNRFGSECPKQPIEVRTLYFNDSILDAAKTPPGLGRPFLFFVVGGGAATSSENSPNLLPSDAPPLRRTLEPYVEDITRPPARGSIPTSPTARLYRLVYPGIDGGPPRAVVISCGGETVHPVGRACFTPLPYRFRQYLFVRYTFQQDRLPPAASAKSDDANAMREAEGVLAFDKAIRAWIDRLQEKP